MIIFEGPDCAGKSTLARAMVRKLLDEGVLTHYERYGFLPPDWDYKGDYIRSCKIGAVLDRFVVSEAVYGRLWRGGPNPKLFYGNTLDAIATACAEAGGLTVYVDTDLGTLYTRLQARGDKHVTAVDLPEIIRLFNDYLLGTECKLTHTSIIRASGVDVQKDVALIWDTYRRIIL